MSDVWYLALAYGVIWLGLFAYLFRLAGQAETLRRDLALLRGMLQGERAEAEK
jgi:CcmD family protein